MFVSSREKERCVGHSSVFFSLSLSPLFMCVRQKTNDLLYRLVLAFRRPVPFWVHCAIWKEREKLHRSLSSFLFLFSTVGEQFTRFDSRWRLSSRTSLGDVRLLSTSIQSSEHRTRNTNESPSATSIHFISSLLVAVEYQRRGRTD